MTARKIIISDRAEERIEKMRKFSADISEECLETFESNLRLLVEDLFKNDEMNITTEMFSDTDFYWIVKRNHDVVYNGGLNFSNYSKTWSINS